MASVLDDPNALARYRHDVTGLLGIYPVRLGDNDPHLKRVKPDAKPLAPALIPNKSKSSGDAPRKKEEE